MLTPSSVIQRREPLTSGPISSVATISTIETANTISARAADLPRRQERHADQHDEGRQQEHHVAVEEVERIEPDPGRDRRARRQRQDDAAQHQRDDRRQQQAIHGPPPVATAGCVVHGRAWAVPRRQRSCPLVAHDGFQGVNGSVYFATLRRSACRHAPRSGASSTPRSGSIAGCAGCRITAFAAMTPHAPGHDRSHHRLHARQRRDQVAELGAADFEIAVLVERGAGRRQQHHGIGEPRGFRIARGVGDRDIERLAKSRAARARRACRQIPARPRRSDRPCGCAGNIRSRPVMPPAFGLPPAIQKISAKDDSACAAASALVPLESLTNSTLPRRPTCSMRCARPGKLRRPFCRRLGRDAQRQRAGRRAGRILRIVQAAQRADAADPRDLAARAAGRAHDGFALDIDAVGQRVLHGDAHHALARADRAGRRCCGTSRRRRRRSRCPAAARRRPAAPSPRRNAPACRGGRYGPR